MFGQVDKIIPFNLCQVKNIWHYGAILGSVEYFFLRKQLKGKKWIPAFAGLTEAANSLTI